MSPTIEEQLEAMTNRFNSAQDGLAELSDKLASAGNMIALLEAEKRQWTIGKIQQGNIIQHQLNNSDGVVGKLQDEIIALKKLLKENNIKYD